MKERLWPAGVTALLMHGFVIAAIAFGLPGQKGTSPQDFHVEVMFAREQNMGVIEKPVAQPKISKSAQKSADRQASMPPISAEGSQSSGGDHDPFPTFNPPPIYPLEARRKRIEGIVLIRLSLSEKGTVDKATALPPRTNPLLEDAALEAIQAWRFKPGNRTLEVPIEFKLEA